jgi:hypothetical protein
VELEQCGKFAYAADRSPRSDRLDLADRDLINTNYPRARRAGTLELRLHVLLLERIDRVPVQLQFRRHVLDRRRAAATADLIGKALGVERIVRQKVEPLAVP